MRSLHAVELVDNPEQVTLVVEIDRNLVGQRAPLLSATRHERKPSPLTWQESLQPVRLSAPNRSVTAVHDAGTP